MSNTTRLPQVLTDYRIFFGESGSELIGNAELTLPDLSYMEETIKVSGVAGEINMPIVGQLQSMEAEVKFTTLNRQAAELHEPKAIMLTARGNQQVYNSTKGRNDNQPVSVIMKVMPKSLGLGKFEKASSTDSGNTFEVLSLKLFIDNREVYFIDKLNYIFRVNGTDYLADVRENLGLT